MEKVIVLGLTECKYCEELKEELKKEVIPYKFLDVELKQNTALADRMEALLKTQHYPMIIIERISGSVYLYRADSLNEAKEAPVSFATKVGCPTINSMVAVAKKYIK